MTDKLAAWYAHRQGLDRRLDGADPAVVLSAAGWARSVGGAGPYLTFYSRAATARQAVDEAVHRLDIHELPAARGCTYVVPSRDFALALRVGQPFGGGDFKVAEKLGVTREEIDRLCDAVVRVIGSKALDPDQIREATGSASRSLGEAGKAKGIGTTLPLALGRLQSEGEIRRVPADGRLDRQRYKYIAWRPNPLEAFSMTPDEVNVELARRYFSWIGPASLTDFQSFAGLGVKAAKAAAQSLGLVVVDDGLMATAEVRDAFESFQVPAEPRYVLTASVDSICLLRREKGISELPSHPILDRGRLVGIWEFDPETNTIAWKTTIRRNSDLESSVARTEEYVRDQLGDMRSFSLDSPKSRAPRIRALRS